MWQAQYMLSIKKLIKVEKQQCQALVIVEAEQYKVYLKSGMEQSFRQNDYHANLEGIFKFWRGSKHLIHVEVVIEYLYN